jgi:hypothetical protein
MDVNDKKGLDLLEKWHSGDFTRADEQALQRLLANCDEFSRAAIEGYLEQPETDHLVHLSNLRNRLAQQEKRPSNPLFFRLAVAASFLVCAAIGTWWLSEKSDPTVDGITQETPKPLTPPDTGTTVAAPNNDDIVMSDQSLKKRSATPVIEQQKQYESIESTKPQADMAVNDLNEAMPAPSAPMPTEAEKSSTNDDKIVEAKETESLKKANSNATAQKSQSGAVGVSPPGVGAKVKTRTSAPTPPAPSIGWEQFRKDMETKLKLPQSAKDNGINSGTVTMILDIKPTDGKVRSVLFINRLGYGCDEAAERFVQQYIWNITPGGATKIEVEIEF